ncbi:hypothetical protein Tco_1308998, partial [Tanacetum coccineum]
MNNDSTQDQPGSSSSSIPIRAPLTVDSDSEYYLSSCNSSTTSSVDISSFNDENDGFATYPHDEIVLEQSRVEKCELIRPFVKYPDGNEVKECVGLDKNEIFRPIVKCPDGNDVKDCSDFDKNDIFRPFVKYPDGDNVKDCGGFSKGGVFRPFVNDPCEESSSSGRLGVPVARLSGDCDSGSDIDSVDGVVESVVMAPKVRIFSADEGDDELQV